MLTTLNTELHALRATHEIFIEIGCIEDHMKNRADLVRVGAQY